AALQRARLTARGYDWVVFTSPQGVTAFLEGGVELGSARVACIGPSTAEALAPFGRRPDVIPKSYVAEGLLQALEGHPMEGRRVLIPRAAEAREVLPETLRERGARVDVVPAYRTVPERDLPEALLRERVDAVTFTASSTVKGFHTLLGGRRPSADFPAVAIGPVTAGTCRELGFPVLAMAENHTVEGLVEALVGALSPE
ncbi:MAG: uroporphyrinogen-III synthase, partial [Candidatus Eremiobacterota bacterium]